MNSAFVVPRRPDAVSRFLVLLFLLGVYLGVAVKLPGGIPVPDVIAGLAGCLLLLTKVRHMDERHLIAIFGVLVLYAVTVLAAPDYRYLIERFKGFIQLSYSVLIGYAFFLVATRYRRSRLARIFLVFSILILIGCALENYTPPRASATTSAAGHSTRACIPPISVTSCSMDASGRSCSPPSRRSSRSCSRCSASRGMCLRAAARKFSCSSAWSPPATSLIRGPSLLLGVALVPAYELLLASRRGPADNAHLDFGRAAGAIALAVIIVGAAIPLVHALYANRLEAIFSGEDPSFFSRVIAPPLVAFKVIATHPIAGAGLTGWEFIDVPTHQVYATAPWFSSNYRFGGAALSITNFFWLHWIFLGLFWGGITAGCPKPDAAQPRRAEHRLLLDHLGRIRAGRRLLRRPPGLDRAVPGGGARRHPRTKPRPGHGHTDSLRSRRRQPPGTLADRAAGARTEYAPMRILHLSTSDIRGGAARGTYWLHQALRDRGVDSLMLVGRKFSQDGSVSTVGGPLARVSERVRDAMDLLPLRRYDKTDESFWTVGWVPRRIRRVVESLRPDIIHLHWTGGGFLPISALRSLGRPLVWTLRDMWAFTGGCHYSAGCDRY